jgi:hypothetical protein
MGLAVCLISSYPAVAGGRNLADYPLRVHVYEVRGVSHYQSGSLNFVDGEGRANLFENGGVRGFDFGYRCSERFHSSMGYETYPARWRKPGKELELLFPEMGKPGTMNSCDLKVDVKDGAYFKHNGLLGEEPAATFKEWMVKHQYDPEHGKGEPVRLEPEAPPAAQPNSPHP